MMQVVVWNVLSFKLNSLLPPAPQKRKENQVIIFYYILLYSNKRLVHLINVGDKVDCKANSPISKKLKLLLYTLVKNSKLAKWITGDHFQDCSSCHVYSIDEEKQQCLQTVHRGIPFRFSVDIICYCSTNCILFTCVINNLYTVSHDFISVTLYKYNIQLASQYTDNDMTCLPLHYILSDRTICRDVLTIPQYYKNNNFLPA